jgi:hypothetical protein
MPVQPSFRRWTRAATRVLGATLAAAVLAAPSALAQDLRSPDARDAAAAHADDFTGPVRAPDWLAPGAREAAPVRTPTAVAVTSGQGFDWPSAGIGAGGGIALVVIAVAGAAAVTGRSRPAAH